MKYFCVYGGLITILAVFIEIVQPTCVLESDFGFKINCAFKKSGLFRVRNLGGIKAHASLGFSLGDELGFEQSLTNLDPSRRRSVSVKNGVPTNTITQSSRPAKQEKRGKQNRIMMRPMPQTPMRPNQAAMEKLSTLHRRASTTMQPIIVQSSEVPVAQSQPKPTVTVAKPTITLAKPIPMGVPPFKPLPPKEDTLKVLPIASTTQTFTQIPHAKGPGLAYQSENYPQSHNQVSKMVSQMTAVQYAQPLLRITPAPIIINTPKLYPLPTTVNPFIPMPLAAPPTQAISIMAAPQPMHVHPHSQSHPYLNTVSIQTNPVSNFLDPRDAYAYNTKKVDDYNTITGYGDDTTLKINKEDINSKIVEIAKAGNISMEAVEAAISLRQQQLLSKYANMPAPSTTTTTTTTTQPPRVFQMQPEPELVAPVQQKPKRNPTIGKVMNAPREYYPVGYEKNFDDQFQTKVDLPETDFHCGDQKYFPGLYGDESLGCMVFHVCALTDDGLVMKSFLCPESTLFDQTILKCNWWFYVDCKSTRRLYDTNIPVSKSYQLMKALTFFSSYKKEMQDEGRPTSPEDVHGIKEAISILENQDKKQAAQFNKQNTVQIVTPLPVLDERNNKLSTSSESSPVYRGTRNYNHVNGTKKTNIRNSSAESSSEVKLFRVSAGINVGKISNTNSTVNSSESAEKRYRRRMTLKNTPITAKLVEVTTSVSPKPKEMSTPSVEIIKQEIRPIEQFTINDVKQVSLTDELGANYKIDEAFTREAELSPPVRRFYRSSAENGINEDKELVFVNNEKVQIVRPTSARLVGDYQTPTAVINKLDEAILGSPNNSRIEKSSAVTPEQNKNRIHTNQT
ncbi:hypothetical protein ACJJTC_017034 [Scirpophaga incertulas]